MNSKFVRGKVHPLLHLVEHFEVLPMKMCDTMGMGMV